MPQTNETSGDDPLYLLLAQDAGLQLALADCAPDVRAAIAAAKRMRNALPPLAAAAEPWPPMRAREDA